MTTLLGKELRKLRIDRSERLADMAARVGKSPAFISAVETGKKSPPSGFEDMIAGIYGLAVDHWERLRSAADQARHTFALQPNNALAKDTAGLLARKIDTLSEDQLNAIKAILHRAQSENQ